ncbi:MAG: PLP-dependent aminotransferase family protein [Clostridiales bacterium]|nr:PLP-dependent aminotransferase family protein [Clostridiales bacterium]
MLTYSFEDRGKDSLYEYLYKQIKNDINAHKLAPQEKLPSKRALAKHLNISTITVENAYSQLVAEGYIYSIPKSGFYVNDLSGAKHGIEDLHRGKPEHLVTGNLASGKGSDSTTNKTSDYFVDFVNNAIATDNFPFTTWTKLLRETMSDYRDKLMTKSPSVGVYQLRCAIVDYLYQFRGITVTPEQIVVGAGTEYLYGLIIQLLGHDRKYAVEDPGYQKISRIYQANRVECVHIPLDENGVDVDALEESHADVLHITPSHHFPTGLVTPISRRYELLSWASKSKDRFIIEDDYDSEFRLQGKPIPALQSIDVSEKVIYINTFSKSLTSTIRISYMVLPKALMERYNKELSFYACTVSNFEQYTLAKFIEQGYLEKHINRMRNYYRNIRDIILKNINNRAGEKKIHIMEEDAGLHFLMQVSTSLKDKELIDRAAQNGVNISCLSQYYYDQSNAIDNTFIINYSGVHEEKIEEAVDRLFESF